MGPIRNQNLILWPDCRKEPQREKIDWQETRKFDCRLVRAIFNIYCRSSIFTRQDIGEWARKSSFDS